MTGIGSPRGIFGRSTNEAINWMCDGLAIHLLEHDSGSATRSGNLSRSYGKVGFLGRDDGDGINRWTLVEFAAPAHPSLRMDQNSQQNG
jgi:hypothetical protein